MHYTQDQTKAIEHSGHNILVSASAGSGKTAVLVERVIQKVLNGTNVDDLLIVTFTRLAAHEMKDRIQKAVQSEVDKLSQKQERTKQDRRQLNHFRRQLNRLHVAHISTIHAFCEQIIHKFYYLINVDPEFTILEDAAQTTLLKQQAFDDVREVYYNANDTLFFQLTENFSNDKNDDGLEQMIFALYDYMRAFPDPKQWLQHLPDTYQNSQTTLDNALYKNHIIPQLKTRLTKLQTQLQQAIDEMTQLDLPKNVEYIQNLLQQYQNLNIDSATYSQLQETLPNLAHFDRRKFSYPKGDQESKLQGDAITIAFKANADELKSFVADYFALPEKLLTTINDQSQQLMTKLIEVVQEFDQGFQAQKVRRNFIDFSDLEHFAYTILNFTDDHQQQPAQTFYRHQFDEVLIDEYQDINPLQENLLKLVSRDETNRFMVGDIKQSIYGFRMADPHLFAEKYATYQPGADADKERIVLASNFRSTKSVTEFVNYIFAQLMDTQLGDVPYDKNAYLQFGANYYPDSANHPVEMLVAALDKPDKEKNDQTTTEISIDQTNLDSKLQKPGIDLMIQRIQKMMQNQETIYDSAIKSMRPIDYRDIVILVPTRSDNLDIIDHFKNANIPLMVGDTNNYFQTTELRIMLSMLEIIDNPDQDIPLVAVLRSPMVGLDENELGFIRSRIKDSKKSFYDCLVKVVKEDLFNVDICRADFSAKLNRFAQNLTTYRDLARNNQLADLIWQIYTTTGFLDYVSGMPSGAQRQANLNALYDRAQQYEQNGFKGIFQFVHFIEEMQKNDKDLAEPNLESAMDNAVTVMTIHKSKGLEFPVVFLFGLEKGFNQLDTHNKYAFSQKLGLGLTYLTDKRVLIPTVQRSLIMAEKHQFDLAEKLRLLYVAMTRAKQRLLLVTTLKESPSKTFTDWYHQTKSAQTMIPLDNRLKAQNFLELLGPALVRGGDNTALKDYAQNDLNVQLPHTLNWQITAVDASGLQTTQQKKVGFIPKQPQVSERFKKQVESRLNHQYNNLVATKTTAYQSVTDIKRKFDDPDLNSLTEYTPNLQVIPMTTSQLTEPEFLRSSNVSAAQLGTATHLVFQKLNLTEPVDLAHIGQTIEVLLSQKLLTLPLAKAIDREQILSFFTTELGQKILQSPTDFHRETAFSMVYPANQLFAGIPAESTQNVLIHGMIDGFLQTEDALILVDYKTDRTKDAQIHDRYQGQIRLYALALAKISQQPVTACYLYALNSRHLIGVQV